MNTLTFEHFSRWMESYGRASEEDDACASANLFTQGARYYEGPFDEPIEGRDAIHAYWLRGAQTLKDKESAFEILAVEGNLGIARWKAKFTTIKSNQRIALDCLFVVEFDEDGLCQTFREWWHTIAD
ncbi:MAG: nuclear transport factor 2 family protein [Anaerolineae bacterium]|nr:nuclear transport factor 2 family protein [Anaerolineae bacterium]